MSLRDLLRHGRLTALLAVAFLLVTTGPSPAQTQLRLSLDWRIDGPGSFLVVAQDRGYFRQEGIDIVLDEGAAAFDPLTRVASGSHAFGFADINAYVRYRDQNSTAPLKAIFMVYNRPAFSVVARKSRGISEPGHLEGKRLGAPPTGSTFAAWPLFAKLNNIDVSKVTIDQIGIPVRAPMLAAGQIDAALGYSFRIYVDLKDRGVPVNDIVLLLMANYNLKLYGNAIIVNSKFAAEKPELVSGFSRALVKGLKETIRNPNAAIDLLVKRVEGVKKGVEAERLRMSIQDNIVTPEVRANGLGAVDTGRLADSIEQLSMTYAFKGRPKADDIFDPAFLPPAADRRAN